MYKRWQTSIYWKIVFTFIFALAVPAIIATIYIIAILRQQELNIAKQQAYATITEQQSQIDAMLDDVLGSLMIVSQIPTLTDYLVARDATTKIQIQQLFSVITTEKPIYDQVRLLSPEGMELIRVNHNGEGNVIIIPDNDLQDKSTRDYYEAARDLAPDDVYISAIEPNQEFGVVEQPIKPVIRYAKAIYADEKIVGIVVFNVLVDELFNLISNDTLNESFYLVSDDGDLVFTSNGSRDLLYATQLGHDSTFYTVFSSIASSVLPDAIYSEPHVFVDDEHNRYITYATITQDISSDPCQWLLITYRPLTDVLKDVNQSVYNLLLLGGFTLGIALIGIGILANRLSHPVQLLHRATHELAKSEWAESQKLIRMVNSNDEIGALASTFEDMIYEVQKSHEILEERVEQRTAELNQANHQLRQQEKIKTRFLEDMAHEIRTPIASLSLNAELIARNPKKQQKYLNNIIHQVQRVRMLSENIMQMARLDFANPVQTFEPVDVSKLVHLITDVHQSLAEEKDLQLIPVMNADLPTIYGNYNQLSQVVDNLVTNAIKYTEQGTIQVTATHNSQAELICISVTDTGIGMTEGDVARIFNRYYRAPQVRQTSIHGTGLGMAIVKDIIDIHHGTIEIESTIGEGTAVSVCLPITQPTTQ